MLAGSTAPASSRPSPPPATATCGPSPPQIAEDLARRGGGTTEREGRWGTEPVCQMPVQRPDGPSAPSRRASSASTASAGCSARPSSVVPRWSRRHHAWEDALARVVVRRGTRPCRSASRCPVSPAGRRPPGEVSRGRELPAAPSPVPVGRQLRPAPARPAPVAPRPTRPSPIADAPEREHVVVNGVLRTVTLRPRGGVPRWRPSSTMAPACSPSSGWAAAASPGSTPAGR